MGGGILARLLAAVCQVFHVFQVFQALHLFHGVSETRDPAGEMKHRPVKYLKCAISRVIGGLCIARIDT